MNANYYLLTLFIPLLPLHATLAARVPKMVVAGQDVYQAPEPGQVSMEGFLGNRMEINWEGRLKNYIYQEDVLLAGFRKRPGSESWNKSLNPAYAGEYVGKWLHAATLAWENKPNDTTLFEKIRRIANGLMDCQMKDGYLGTYVKEDRWKSEFEHAWDVWVHKYDLIGLLSYYRTTGDEGALETCRRMGDLLIRTFADNKRDISKSGAHAGMAATAILEPMALLYEYTGEQKYRQFCEYIIQRADAGPKILTNIEKTHSVVNVGDGKGYEMMCNYLGLVEYWRATGYGRGLHASELAWESIAKDHLFITGAPASNPHFRSEPISTSGKCVETCDQVTWLQLNWQLLRATGDCRYAAMLHRHIYNHMLAAQHPDGIRWCYYTQMEGTHYPPPANDWWSFGYSGAMHCCGSSGPRAIALIPTFAYMTGKDKLAINLYETSTFRASINGIPVVVSQQTNYPWDGHIDIDLDVEQPTEFDLQLLIPSFAQSATIYVSGSKQNGPIEAGHYATVHRRWSGKTTIILDLPMPIVAHPRNGRVALSRGPIVLALEEIHGESATFQNVIPDLSSLQEASWEKPDISYVTVNQRTRAVERHRVTLKGKKPKAENRGSSNELPLVYRPYCEAGTSPWQTFSIWMPMLGHDEVDNKETKYEPVQKRDRYLLLDERIIAHTENAELTLGKVRKHPANPLFGEDKPWEKRFDNLYANVIYDEQEKLYKCWYSPFIVDISAKGMTIAQRRQKDYDPPDNREMAICYAISKDGIRWKKPEMGLVEFEGSKANNILWRGTTGQGGEHWHGPHGTGIFKDYRDPDPQRRYKAFLKAEILSVAFSPDGIHWGPAIACPEADSAGDTHNNAFWAPTLGQYVGITRQWAKPFGRQVARTFSKDFVNWHKCEIVLEGTDPRYQTYAMPVFFHGGIYLGLVAIHDQQEDRVWTELTWSPDTTHWHRVLPGTPLIPNTPGQEGDYDWGCVYAAACPVFLKDSIRLYYGGSDGHHSSWRNGFFCLATLRPDGFAGYKPIDSHKPAKIMTTPIADPQAILRLSADVGPEGYLKVKVFDKRHKVLAESEPLKGRFSDKQVKWQDGLTLDNLGQNSLQMEFEFQDATVYSFSFKVAK